MLPRRGLLLLYVAMFCTALGCSVEKIRNSVAVEGSPQWHAEKLAQGDLRISVEGTLTGSEPGLTDAQIKESEIDFFYAFQGEPYHLRRLIDMGPRSADALIGLLSNLTITPIDYEDGGEEPFVFWGSHHLREMREGQVIIKRKATIADLADYALREIYHKDMDFRSYHGQQEQKLAAERWRRLVGESGTDQSVGRSGPRVYRGGREL